MPRTVAFALGAVVVLGGCASGGLSQRRTSVASRAALPPPRVIRRTVSSRPVSPSPVISGPVHAGPVARPVVIEPRVVATTTARPPTPAPPSMELMRGHRAVPLVRRDLAGPTPVVPVSRTARVQPAVAAPVMPPREAVATPRPAASRGSMKGLFAGAGAPRAAPEPCVGGT